MCFPEHLRGKVVDESGETIAGVEVYALPADTYMLSAGGLSKHCSRTTTNTEGRFTLPGVFSRGNEVVFRRAGYVPTHVSASEVPLDREVVITLSKGGVLTGRVVTAAGRPIEDAVVRARTTSVYLTGDYERGFPAGDALYVERAVTTDDGRFRIGGLRENVFYVVECHAPGFAMATPAWRDPDMWKAPSDDVGSIVMNEMRVAIVGVRAGDIDYSRSAKWWFAAHQEATVYPDGYETAYSGVPLDRFPWKVLRVLRAASRAGVLIMAKGDGSGHAPSNGPANATLLIVTPGGKTIERVVELRPVGMDRWAQRQWIDFPPESHPDPGILIISTTGDPEKLRGSLILAQEPHSRGALPLVFGFASGQSRGALKAIVPAGEYVLYRQRPTRRLGQRYDVRIESGHTTRIEVSFGSGPFLKIDPRYPSGAPARETAIYLRRRLPDGKHEWLFNLMEPYGCLDGPEVIEVTPELRGEIEILVRKYGFELASHVLKLGNDNVVHQPVLETWRGR
jgi:hypothetical protein